MRLPKQDLPSEARRRNSSFFRELFQARMLWAATGTILLTFLGGLLFYKQGLQIPLQHQTKSDNQPVSQQSPQSTNQTNVVRAATNEDSSDPHTASPATSSSSTNKTAATTPTKDSAVAGTRTVCVISARDNARTARDTQTTAENERFEALINHSPVQQLLSTFTGGISNTVTAADQQEHESIISRINSVYIQAIAAAHC